MNRTLLRFDSVTRFFPPDVYAVRDLSLEIQKGSWTLIKGPSGSGKSTILHMAAGLDIPTSGSIYFNGLHFSKLSSRERAGVRQIKIGLVFQQFYLVPYLNSLENLLLAQHFHSTTDVSDAKRVLSLVGLTHRAKHHPSELSGGEKQRLCVARSIVNSPEFLLADEPTASLDEASQKQILELFAELRKEGVTILMTSHDPIIDAYAGEIRILKYGRLEI